MAGIVEPRNMEISPRRKRLVLLVPTCLSFSDIWQASSFFLSKNWPYNDVVVVSDSGAYPEVGPIHSMVCELDSLDFSGRLLFALKRLDCDYVCLMLDDYFLTKPISKARIDEVLKTMDDHGLDYLHFDKTTGYRKFQKSSDGSLRFIDPSRVYSINTCPCFWKKGSLERVLVTGESAWEAEVRFAKRFLTEDMKGGLTMPSPLPYVDGVRKGKLLPKANRILKREGLYSGSRETMPVWKCAFLSIRHFMSVHLPEGLANFIRRKSSNKDYYRDKAD